MLFRQEDSYFWHGLDINPLHRQYKQEIWRKSSNQVLERNYYRGRNQYPSICKINPQKSLQTLWDCNIYCKPILLCRLSPKSSRPSQIVYHPSSLPRTLFPFFIRNVHQGPQNHQPTTFQPNSGGQCSIFILFPIIKWNSNNSLLSGKYRFWAEIVGKVFNADGFRKRCEKN